MTTDLARAATTGHRSAPRFSILIPVWNGAAWLPGAIESVLGQTFQDFECIVSDNASDDDVTAALAGYQDQRVRTHRWPDHVAIFDNFDRSLPLCAGEWVLLLPADDRLLPGCLERMAQRIDAYRGARGLAAVFPRALRIDPQSRPMDVRYHGYQGEATIADGTYDAAGWLRLTCARGSAPWDLGPIRRATLDEMGLFFRADIPSMSADLELTIRVAAFGDVEYIDEPLMAVTGSASSHTPGRWRGNLESREPFTPRGIAYAEGLRCHERRRAVGRAERALVRGAIARTHLRRATAQRTDPAGHGRRGALTDVLAAARLSPGTVARELPLAIGLVLAPSRVIMSTRERLLARREQAGTPGAKRS